MKSGAINRPAISTHKPNLNPAATSEMPKIIGLTKQASINNQLN